MDILSGLPASFPELYDASDSIKVVEVAKKYSQPEVRVRCHGTHHSDPQGVPIKRVPEYTKPGGPHSYHCSKG